MVTATVKGVTGHEYEMQVPACKCGQELTAITSPFAGSAWRCYTCGRIAVLWFGAISFWSFYAFDGFLASETA